MAVDSGLLGLLVVFACGFLALLYGLRELSVAVRLHRADATPIGGVTPDQRVEIEGTARPSEEPIEAPFSGESTLYGEWRVKQRHTDEAGTEWATEQYEYDGVPFLVEDQSGTALVYPAGVDTRLTEDVVAEVSSSDSPPDRIERALDDRGWSSEDGTLDSVTEAFQGPRRFVEARLDADTTAYVVGKAREPTHDEPSKVHTVFEPDESLFVLSDEEEPQVVRRVLRDSAMPLFLALVMLGASVFIGFVMYG
ncbi:hypothetical protein [Haloarchaeobius sp. DFWS5]|uniref:hypothetical protein n=1 Tax=Haloarchaeobius sp. DFWS5 TaxID=3446114 RepID=UPI003EC13A88